MKIGILGAGNVGSALGRGWVRSGHEVMFSSRNPNGDRMKELIATTDGMAQAGTIQETVDFGEVILIALPWGGALEDVMSQISDWSGKVVMDATNRFDTSDSPGKEIKRMVGVPTVKAFNTIWSSQMENPVENTSLIVCGDEEAKSKVAPLVSDLGFEMVDAGPIDNAHLLEAYTQLLMYLTRSGIGRELSFQLLKQ